MFDKTCSERLPSHLSNRLSRLSELFIQVETPDEEISDQAHDEIANLPLSIEKMEVIKILLSTGGPADWFEFHVDREASYGRQITRIEYHFQDWFDHASIVLDGEDFYAAEQFCSYFLFD